MSNTNSTEWCAAWNARYSERQILPVRWLLNPQTEPQRNVGLVVQSGQLLDVVPLSESAAAAAQPVAIMPPLVNAHTHLEFSRLRSPLQPATPFTSWIRSVIQYRRENPDTHQIEDAIHDGMDQLRSSGTGAAGEIVTARDIRPLLRGAMPVVAFRECIGLSVDTIDSHLQRLDLDRATLSAAEQDGTAACVQPSAETKSNVGAVGTAVRCGVSPHASYSVHPQLMDALVDYATQYRLPAAMHLAETIDEVELLHEGTGRFREFLKAMGLWKPELFAGGRSILEFLQRLAVLPSALVIHGNYLTDEELEFLSRNSSLSLVYCPRTHAWFGHRPHPWLRLFRSGCRVLLGTDSRASNPDLSVWRELQLAARAAPEIPLANLLPMVTTWSAEALGMPVADFQIVKQNPLSGSLIPCDAGSLSELESWARRPGTDPRLIIRNGIISLPLTSGS